MKPYLKILLLVFAGICGVLFCEELTAQTVASGTQLEIGAPGADQVANGASIYSGAIGSSNSVTMTGSMAIGLSNEVFASYSMALGIENGVVGGRSFAVGKENIIEVEDSLAVGSNNELRNLGSATSNQSLVVGAYNISEGARYSFIAGMNNYAYSSEASATMGYGLINPWSDCVVVGRYNAYDDEAALLFVVGNGTDSINDRKNAFEVYADGTVIIPTPQGDIGMGEFGE